MNSAPSAADVLGLEQVGYDLWVAPETVELDGWVLRHAHGITSRANSVWPNGDGSLDLPEKIDAVENWYRERGMPPRFQLTDAARPRELASALAARGYRTAGDPVSVEVAQLEGTAPDPAVECSERLHDDWLSLWTESRAFDRLDVARQLLTGSPGRTVFARLGDVAIGRGVAHGDWLGVTSMVTVPAARRRGHARSIVSTLVAWAVGLGCSRGLLQVEATNGPARGLYAQLGFRPSHEYRYAVER